MSDTPRTDAATHDDWSGGAAAVEFEVSQQLERELSAMTDITRELRNALKRLVDNGHTEDCSLLNHANGECDCGVALGYSLFNKSKEILP